MATSLEAFKRLLMQVPKLDTTDDFHAENVYQYYLAREKRYEVDSFFGLTIDSLITKLVDRQDRYNELYDKYREVAKHLSELYKIKNPN